VLVAYRTEFDLCPVETKRFRFFFLLSFPRGIRPSLPLPQQQLAATTVFHCGISSYFYATDGRRQLQQQLTGGARTRVVAFLCVCLNDVFLRASPATIIILSVYLLDAYDYYYYDVYNSRLYYK